jgi:hypothetical protein
VRTSSSEPHMLQRWVSSAARHSWPGRYLADGSHCMKAHGASMARQGNKSLLCKVTNCPAVQGVKTCFEPEGVTLICRAP